MPCLKAASPALVKVLHLVRTTPCNAALIPLLTRVVGLIRLLGVGGLWPWMHFLGFRSSLPQHHRVLFCSMPLSARTLPRGPWDPGTSPCRVLRSVPEATNTIRLRWPVITKEHFQSILSLQLGLMQQSLIRCCRRVVTYGHVLQCSLGFELACSRDASSKAAAAPLPTRTICKASRAWAWLVPELRNHKGTASPSVKSAFCKLLGLELSLFQELFHWSPQSHYRLKGSFPSSLVSSLACPELHHQRPLAYYHQNSSKHLPHCSGTITS